MAGMAKHWHLIEPREWSMQDRDRHDHDRMQSERSRADAVAHTPAEAVEWLIETTRELVAHHGLTDDQLRSSGLLDEDDMERRIGVWREMADRGESVCRMLAVGERRIVHYSAYAVDCYTQH